MLILANQIHILNLLPVRNVFKIDPTHPGIPGAGSIRVKFFRIKLIYVFSQPSQDDDF